MKTSLLVSALVALPSIALAQTYPSQQPIQVVVPFAAGGAADIMARSFAKVLSTQLGQKTIVLNTGGAGGTLGFWQVVRAPANGYMLAYGPSTPLTAGALLTSGPKFDQITPVCQTHENIMTVVVRKDSPLKSIQQLLTEAKAKSNYLAYGHAGTGTVPHLSMEHFGLAAGASFNAVAYRGDSPMLVDLLGGRLDFGVSSISLPSSNDTLRVLAVFADERQPRYPEAPAVRELGVETLAPGLNGLFAPPNTPTDVLALLEKTCEDVVKTSDFQGTAQTLSQRPAYLNGKQFKVRLARDFVAMEKTIRALNLK